MRCEKCQGKGVVREWSDTRSVQNMATEFDVFGSVSWFTVPCPACGGTGAAHCCDGECAQPDR